jgi:hypothetical protein
MAQAPNQVIIALKDFEDVFPERNNRLKMMSIPALFPPRLPWTIIADRILL